MIVNELLQISATFQFHWWPQQWHTRQIYFESNKLCAVKMNPWQEQFLCAGADSSALRRRGHTIDRQINEIMMMTAYLSIDYISYLSYFNGSIFLFLIFLSRHS
jgi:hypothetical protein